MRVLFVSSGNRKNGLNPIIRLQAESITRQGVEISHFLIFGKGWLGYLKNISKLKKYLKDNPVDLIHAHFGFSCIVAQLAKGKIPLLVTLMGTDVMGQKDSKGSIGLKNGLNLFLNRFFANHVYHHAIVMSEKMKQTLSRKKATFIISNGVDTSLFFPLNRKDGLKFLGWKDDMNHFIFLANPERPEKNFKLAATAVELLKSKGYAVELHAVYQEIPENLKYYYAAATALLLPSFHEGSPNVVKEAFACNRPIVFTDVGDVTETTQGLDGYFLAPHDVEGFAEQILKAIEFMDKFGETQGRERIEALEFDEQKVAKKIINLYKKIIR